MHISVCICTFKRPDLLKRLLDEMDRQMTEGLFSYSVVVADNDRMQSARHVVTEFAAASSLPITYCVEPEQNIALARNRALENVKGDFVAFIDDDEIPGQDWLCSLLKTGKKYEVAGVLGPVKPYFEHKPPQWVSNGKFFERPTYHTGYQLDWRETRTGNVLFRRDILDGVKSVFRPEFGTGSEDTDFFKRMMEKGNQFVWCNEAVVHEVIPSSRCTRSYLLRRALLRGRNSLRQRADRVRNLSKSLIAVPVYGLALPFYWIAGEHHFLKLLIRFCDHAGRLLGVLGFNPVKERDL